MLKGASNLMYGDPTKTVPGPDGTPVPDTGYLGLKGAAALNARPQVEQQLDTLIQGARGNLTTPEQQLQFDSFTRRYRTTLSEQIGSHSDQAATDWYGKVNTDSFNLAVDGVTKNPMDPATVAQSASDATAALMKQAQIEGADVSNPNDPLVQNAKLMARKAVLSAQVKAIGATDPSTALRILTKNRDLVGTDFEPLYDTFSEKADQQSGSQFGTSLAGGHAAQAAADYVASPANPSLPVYQQAATDIPGGMSPNGLARTVQIESGGKDVTNASGHVGYGQFSSSTWAQYGGGGSPHDFGDSVAAVQRYAAANAKYLTPILGRTPTDAELYLAHQQGPNGAAQLLTNPNVPAQAIVGYQAVAANLPPGEQANVSTVTAGQYVAMWTHKFNGTTPAAGSDVATIPQGPRSAMGVSPTGAPAGPQSVPAAGIPASPDAVAAPTVPEAPVGVPLPAPEAVGEQAPAQQPASPKADAYQQIMASDMTPRAKQYAMDAYNRQASALQIAADQSATQVKAANDQAMNTYTSQILQGNFPPVATIANDPKLTAEGKKAMSDLMLQHADMTAAGATQAYGGGFYKVMGQIIAPLGDPSRISDPTQIYAMAAQPGGPLTLAGAAKIVDIMGKVTKSVDDSNTTDALHSLIAGQKQKMSFQQDTGPTQIKDPQGEQLFNNRFVPKALGAYDQWIKDGKDPWQFLTQDNFDKMSQGLRSPREMAMAQLAAQTDPNGLGDLPAPPVPQGADPDGWKLAVNAAPDYNGKPLSTDQWAGILTTLVQDPTPHTIRRFDEHFAASGVTGQDILSALTPQADKPMTQWPHFAAPPAAANESQPAPPPAATPGLDPRLGLGPYQ